MEVEQAQQAQQQQQQDGQQQQAQDRQQDQPQEQQQQDGGTFDMWAPQVRPGAACGWSIPLPDSQQRWCHSVQQPGCGPCARCMGWVPCQSLSPSLIPHCTPSPPLTYRPPQHEDARKAAEAAAAATASQPPYLLKLAKKSSYGSGVNTYG